MVYKAKKGRFNPELQTRNILITSDFGGGRKEVGSASWSLTGTEISQDFITLFYQG